MVKTVTFFGNTFILATLGLAVALALAALRRWSLLLGWSAALVDMGVLNAALKAVVRRLRPELPHPWVTESGWSFPSGHAMASLVTYGFLAYLLTRAKERAQRGGRNHKEPVSAYRPIGVSA